MSSQILSVLIQGKNDTQQAFGSFRADVDKATAGALALGKALEEKYGPALKDAAQLERILAEEAKKLAPVLKQAGDETKRWTEFGKGLAAGVGLGAFTGLTSAVTASVRALKDGYVAGRDFELQMTRIETLTGAQASLVAQWRNELLQLGPAVGKGPKELGDALYFVTSAGITGANALEVVRKSAQASAIGLGETEVVARTVTAAINAYGSENLSAAHATSVLFAAVREGGAEATSLAGSLGRVLPIASQLGVSFEEVASSVAVFTRLGVNAEEAVTALRGTLSVMEKGNKQGQETLKELGLSYADLRREIQEKGLAATLIDLVQRFKGNEEALAKVIPNVRALSGVLANAGSQGEAYAKVVQSVSHAEEDFAAALARTEQTGAQTWAKLNAAVDAFQILVVSAAGKNGELNGTVAQLTTNIGLLNDKLQEETKTGGGLPEMVSQLLQLSTNTLKVIEVLQRVNPPLGTFTGYLSKMPTLAMTAPMEFLNRLADGVRKLGEYLQRLPMDRMTALFRYMGMGGPQTNPGGGGPFPGGPNLPTIPLGSGGSEDRYYEESAAAQRKYLEAVMKNQQIEEAAAKKHHSEMGRMDREEEARIKANTAAFIHDVRIKVQQQKEEDDQIKANTAAFIHDVRIRTQAEKEAQQQEEAIHRLRVNALAIELQERQDYWRRIEEEFQKHLETMGDISNLIGTIGQTIGGTWGEAIDGAARVFENFLGRVKDGFFDIIEMAQTAMEIYQGGYSTGRSIGKKGGSPGKGALAGAGQGAVTGAAIGTMIMPGWGTAIGAGVGAIAGGIGGWLGGKKGQAELKAQMEEMRKQLLQQYGSMDALRKLSSALGVDISRAFSTKDPKEFQRVMDQLSQAQADQQRRIQGLGTAMQGLGLMTQGFMSTLKDHGVKSGAAWEQAQEKLERYRKKLGELGLDEDELNHRMAVRQRQLLGGIQETTDAQQAAFKRLGDYAAATFGAMVRETGDVIGTLQQMEPTLAELAGAMDEFHLAGSAAMNELLGLRQIVVDNADVAQSIQGLNLLMKGLGEAGIQTSALFQSFGQDLAADFQTLIDRSVPANQALILMQPSLQRLWEHQQKFHDITDEATLALLKQGEDAGIVGEDQKSVYDKILGVLEDIRDLFLGLDGKTVNTHVVVHKRTVTDPGDDPPDDPGNPLTPLASGYQGWVTSPRRFLVGEAGPEYLSVTPAAKLDPRGAEASRTVIYNVNVNVAGDGDADKIKRTVLHGLRNDGAFRAEARQRIR